MAVLADVSIEQALKSGLIIARPSLLPLAVQPTSLDLRLGGPTIKVERRDRWETVKLPYTLEPGECALGYTLETIGLSALISAELSGVSSRGREFLSIHITAGHIDPGFEGEIVLELKNELRYNRFTLHEGMRICQLKFEWTDVPVARPYGSEALQSHYQGQQGAVENRELVR